MSNDVIYLQETHTYANMLGYGKPQPETYQQLQNGVLQIVIITSKEMTIFATMQTLNLAWSDFSHIYCHMVTYLKSTGMSTEREIFIFEIK